ncbi:MAG: SPOR domain-containing protein [Desulfobacterales bacterium]|nr:MAG: SPOR domain-containing protein [Desulfobacterales bacterium]
MTQTLRHFAARIWVSVLVGGLISLWILPHIQSRIGLQWALFPVAIILMLVFWGVGWILNRWGMSALKRLVREAGVYERNGMYPEAENAFRSAVAIFDSFLISQFVKQKKSASLAARMARFYLARADKNSESEAFLVSYLHAHPGDEEVAENWLTQIESRGGLKEEHQELVYRIGSSQPKNKTIQVALARFYLLLERTDFPALQTYRRIFELEDQAAPEFVNGLSQLFLTERRADEWALKIYLQAIEQDEGQTGLLSGIAACVRWMPKTARNQDLLQKAYQCLEGIDQLDLKKMSSGFKPPAPSPAPPKPRRKKGIGTSLNNLIDAAVKGVIQSIFSAVRWIIRWVTSFVDLLKHYRKARRVFAGILLAALTACVAVLLINTVSHLIKTDKAVKKKTEPVASVVTDPFTIQVAAYLAPEHAQRYVVQLKKQGLDAFWTEAFSAEKKWYQVRVSHFPDKKSAREYGESLKSKGIIEDFYVANYRRN